MTRSYNKKRFGFLHGNLIVSILLLLTIIIAGCSPDSSTESPSPTTSGSEIPDLALTIDNRDFLVGTAGLIPPHFPNPSEEDYLEFLVEVPRTGEVLGVYMDWAAPDVIDSIQFAVTYAEGLTPVVALGFDFELVDDTYFSRNLPEIRNTFREVLDTFELDYLVFGIEVNRLIPEISQAAFQDFIIAYHDIYDLVKFHSPDTKVFPIFQLEYLKGAAMLSGLEFEPQWEILEDFEGKLDLVGLTIYPFLEYTSVTEIPLDYYDEIPEKIDLPIAITEMAWLSENVSIVQGSEEAQVEFLLGLLDATRNWDLEMMLYSFLYEPHGVDLFESAGLKTYEGEAKDVYQYWLALAASEYHDTIDYSTLAPQSNKLDLGFSFPPVSDQEGRDFTTEHLNEFQINLVRFAEDWSNREPQPGQYNWDPLDQRLAWVAENEISLLLTIQSDGPDWACDQDKQNPRSCAFRDEKDFKEYLEALLSRYSNQISKIQFGNEWTSDFWYAGSAEEFTQFHNQLYAAVQEHSPQTEVVLGGFSSGTLTALAFCMGEINVWYDSEGTAYSQESAADLCNHPEYLAGKKRTLFVLENAYYDWIDLHFYDNVEEWPGILTAVQELFPPNKPYLVSEFGGPNLVWEQPYDNDFQARRLAEYIQTLAEMGIPEAYYFKLVQSDSANPSHQESGLFEIKNGEVVKKPAYDVFLSFTTKY